MHIVIAHGHKQQRDEDQGKGWVEGVKKKRQDICNNVKKERMKGILNGEIILFGGLR